MATHTPPLQYSVTNIKLRARAKNLLAKLGFEIKRLPKGKPNPIHLWDEDEQFKLIMKDVIGYTLVDQIRCFMLYQLAKQVSTLPGEAAEIGVYKGGTARVLAQTFSGTNKAIHLFDTFGGMPSVDTEKDLHRQMDFRDTSYEKVKSYLSQFNNVHFYPGVFPKTSKPIEGTRFCFVHVDVDIYQSVKDCCHFFYPRLEKGGVLVFDDYGFASCPGVKAAVDAFFQSKPEQPCYLSTGQCLINKL